MWTLTAAPIASTSKVFATATPTRAVPKWNNVGYSDCITSLDATTPSESFPLRKASPSLSVSGRSTRSGSTTTTRKSLLDDNDSGYVSLRDLARRERRSAGSVRSTTSACHSRTSSSDSTLSRTSSVSSLFSSATTSSSRTCTLSIVTTTTTKSVTPRRTPMTREMEADIRAGRIPDPAFGPYRTHTATQAERINHLRVLLKEAAYHLDPEIIEFSKQPIKKRSATEVFWDPREEDEEGEPEVEEKGIWERIKGFFI